MNLLVVKKSLNKKKTVIVTGGAGFIGSHLVKKLISLDYYVIVIDNFITGKKENLDDLLFSSNICLINHDITQEIIFEQIDEIYHLASLASPIAYTNKPIETIETNIFGTINMLKLCEKTGAKIMLASTSEVYGDPNIHPQIEEYFGNVNPTGPRSCYDESKRLAETLFYEYHRKRGVDVRIARIFNTYGPKMKEDDGRVISNFITQALSNKPITINGDGSQTRSMLYVDDLIEAFLMIMSCDYTMPINLGNTTELKIKDLALLIKTITKSNSTLIYLPKMQDDPQKRKPNIEKAKSILNWEPRTSLEDGIIKTIEYFRN